MCRLWSSLLLISKLLWLLKFMVNVSSFIKNVLSNHFFYNHFLLQLHEINAHRFPFNEVEDDNELVKNFCSSSKLRLNCIKSNVKTLCKTFRSCSTDKNLITTFIPFSIINCCWVFKFYLCYRCFGVIFDPIEKIYNYIIFGIRCIFTNIFYKNNITLASLNLSVF